ncbi:regulatory protein RecX [Erwinia pyrifoliae]|uniref:Regulatory protein RecX n=1 Tax=Erwinia pyrifoliae TaxID=79967 RepID=A0ABY5XA73_ERWPY|nr:regulatory protein RecX [Erwinia pyrifoliae]AUX71791.1 recombination regulator RecX [Erwinia pyrifoliae]MCA8877976.1 regulatory protein RecX [Erwinia pyrifoliae]MCT2386272.1 recombination regulator RecX [Erwinia pyrifoliae]MCU8588131.1 recombination regulator RecX [Erwinia pyrifoliae]UWS34266.1 recombination regulator RecX [Erwinia pyrifoliae]
MSDTTERTQYAKLLERAMRILAMRDHSEAEFRRKLVQSSERAARFNNSEHQPEPLSAEQIDRVVDWCYQHSWLDDARFAERYVAGRGRKSYGPQRIRQELGQKGVVKSLIDEVLFNAEIDWQSQAFALAERKFGHPFPTEWNQKAKVQRYLMTKGFFMEDIRAIFENFDD